MRKFFAVMMLAVMIFIGNSQVEAADVYVCNEENGDKVYLMTETIKKEKLILHNAYRYLLENGYL